jgi:hypothetical protein
MAEIEKNGWSLNVTRYVFREEKKIEGYLKEIK